MVRNNSNFGAARISIFSGASVKNMGLSYYIKNVVVIILIVVNYCMTGYVNGSSEI